jgi:MOSC domain-containing protein YiiM
MFQGRLEAIFIGDKGEPLRAVGEVVAVAGVGLEGDRYFARQGTFSQPPLEDREVTLIEAEALDALAADGIPLAPGDARRNLVTRGVPLNHLVGAEIVIGDVVLRGRRLCEPCDHLARLTSRAAMKSMVHRGGLRAQILVGGTLRTGDAIAPRA